MRVLIVDDNQQKIQHLVGHLTKACGLKRDEEILVAQTGMDARRILKDEFVELLILDILLPNRAEDAPASSTAINLIRDLTERKTMCRPGHIVGLTAYEDGLREAEEYFASRLWTIVQYDTTSDEWLNGIEGCVKYLGAAERGNARKEYDFDLCVVNALADPEAAAVLKLPWNWGAPVPLDDVAFFRAGEFMSGDQCMRVAAVCAPRMGMVATALITAKAIERLRPRFVAMTGICAGVRNKVNLGDIVLADPCWDYQSGKRSRDNGSSQFSIDPHQLSVPAFIRAHFENLRNDHSSFEAIRSNWPGSPETVLKLVIGPVASGSAVLADGHLVEEVQEQQRKVLGIEMEIYGLYAAVQNAGYPRPTAFALKSVCDYADDSKDDSYQKYAAYTSASALQLFVERHLHSIRDFAGT